MANAQRHQDSDIGNAAPRQHALALVGRASALLADAPSPMDPAVTHDLRVICKHLRAYWQLLTPRLGRSATRAADHALRDMARRLAPARDAHVFLHTLEHLGRKREMATDARAAAVEAQAFALLADRVVELRARDGNAAPDLRALTALLETGAARLRETPIVLCRRDLRRGLARSQGRARDAGRRALLLQDDLSWHRCRRWVKYERYQWAFLQRACPIPERDAAPGEDAKTRHAAPGIPRGRLRRLERLGDLLGDFHDLWALGAFADTIAPELDAAEARLPIRRVIEQELNAMRPRLEVRFMRLHGADASRRKARLGRWLRRL